MGKPISGGAGGSGGRGRAVAPEVARPREFPSVPYGNEGAEATDYDNFLVSRFAAQAERVGVTIAGISEYEDDSRPINKALRKETVLTGKAKRVTELLDQAMQPLDESIVVHRGAKVKEMFELFASGTLVGASVNDKGFMSTSLNRGVATIYGSRRGMRGIVMKLTIPKGKRVAYTNTNGRHATQREVIIDRGSSVRVTSAKMIGNQLEIEGTVE